MVSRSIVLLGPLLFFVAGLSAQSDSYATLEHLATVFWEWRAVHQPLTGDDIPRIARPTAWLPDWSPATVAERQRTLVQFQDRWRAIDDAAWNRSQRVDYRLIGSAIARVDWELNVYPTWRRNPLFYVDQTLGSIFDLLLAPAPFTEARSLAIAQRIEHIPTTVAAAQQNLDQTIRPFAELAISELSSSGDRLRTVARELRDVVSPTTAARIETGVEHAMSALAGLRLWLERALPNMPTETAIGRDSYLYFLQNVALIPHTPEELVAMARQEWERAVTFEAYAAQRNTGLPEMSLFPSQDAQIAQEARDEQRIRTFLDERGILTVPDWMQHYRNLPMPAYLAPLAHLGVTDDLTGPSRLDEDAVAYVWPPAPDLSYFHLSTARDPRPIVVHEGVPGHYFQMALSWAHENAIRRFYYDSGANEGIGFYAEEMMLQAGLFDDRPRTREIIYNFMRLRALRVEIDVKLALGEFNIADAGDYLRTAVPMDGATADEEAAFFAATPGQAISYQIGKLQITRFLSDARRELGDQFELRAFHDFVWKNGNVPIALLRWELLGLEDDARRLGIQ